MSFEDSRDLFAPHIRRSCRPPGDAAGIEEGDILVSVASGDGPRQDLSYPSQWRAVELAAQPGAVLHVLVDRAGAARKTQIVAVPRVHLPDRQEVVRLREEVKVGVVLRSATEVEARAAGLGPGGGAVVVGLSGGSPWRAAGLSFGDLLVSIDGDEVAHPQAVLDAIRGGEAGDHVSIEFVRDGRRSTIDAPLSRRASELSQFSIPVVFDYESSRGDTEWSLLLGLASYESTIAAWRLRLLWLIKIGGGDADKLVEVK